LLEVATAMVLSLGFVQRPLRQKVRTML